MIKEINRLTVLVFLCF